MRVRRLSPHTSTHSNSSCHTPQLPPPSAIAHTHLSRYAAISTASLSVTRTASSMNAAAKLVVRRLRPTPSVIVSAGFFARLPSASCHVYSTPRLTCSEGAVWDEPPPVSRWFQWLACIAAAASMHPRGPAPLPTCTLAHLVEQRRALRVGQYDLDGWVGLLQDLGHASNRAARAGTRHKRVQPPARLLQDLPTLANRWVGRDSALRGAPECCLCTSTPPPAWHMHAHLCRGAHAGLPGFQTGRKTQRHARPRLAAAPR